MATYSGAALQQAATPCDLLRVGLDSDPDGLALVSARTRLTWQELDGLSTRLARGYVDLGLEPGDRIASLMPNRFELVVHYLACFTAGLVATPLNYRYTAAEIDHALDVSGARALLAHVERDDDLAASERAAGLPLGRISYGGLSAHDRVSFGDLLDGDRPWTTFARPEPTAAAVIFFTSGSTGPPKGVTHTHETLGWMFATAAGGLELAQGDLVLAGSSLSHVGAFYVSFGALSTGAGIVVARTYGADELLPLLREDRPTVLSMLPSALFALTRDHDASHDDFSSLRLCRAAGDKVSAELEREFTARSGFVIDEAYGLTETGLVCISPPDSIRLGSIGRVAPGVSISIRDETGEPVEIGSDGRAWIKTDASCIGYWGNDKATAAAPSSTAGSIRATSCVPTPRGISTSAADASRSSSTTAPTSARRRSRVCYSSTRASRAQGLSEFTISSTARTSVPTSRCARAASAPPTSTSSDSRVRESATKRPKRSSCSTRCRGRAPGRWTEPHSSGSPSPPYTQLATAAVAGDATMSW